MNKQPTAYVFSRDREGQVHVLPAPDPQLEDFVVNEIGKNPHYLKAVKQALEDTRVSLHDSVDLAGNIYQIRINKQYAVLRNVYDEQQSSVQVPRSQLEELIHSLGEFLNMSEFS